MSRLPRQELEHPLHHLLRLLYCRREVVNNQSHLQQLLVDRRPDCLLHLLLQAVKSDEAYLLLRRLLFQLHIAEHHLRLLPHLPMAPMGILLLVVMPSEKILLLHLLHHLLLLQKMIALPHLLLQ